MFLVAGGTGNHIHCCTAVPGSGNAGILVPFTTFTPGLTSGTFSNTFDLLALLGASGESSLIAGLNGGTAYVNVHSSTFPGGEIRGFVGLGTPEPGTIWLGFSALAGLAVLRRRK
ncbi:MAG: CHRD domain-containing protein [Terriglobia bacterium]